MRLFKKIEPLLGIDIGSSGIKIVELDVSENVPKLKNIAAAPLDGNIYSGNSITGLDAASDLINSLLQANEILAKRAAVAVPAPGAFTKRIEVARMSRKELQNNITFEASNYIPHSVEAVKIDYHVLRELPKDKLEVLLVAVKNDVVDSYLDTVALTGLETAVIDVDYFALQNMFELGYPELTEETVALLNLGARYTSINVCKGGVTLFTGDVSLGSKALTDQIVDNVGGSYKEAEKLKQLNPARGPHHQTVTELTDKFAAHMASELNRQLSFFWNAAGAQESISRIMIGGGGAMLSGLCEELGEKTGIETMLINPLKGIQVDESFDPDFLSELGPKMSIAVGLAIRDSGDKVFNVDIG